MAAFWWYQGAAEAVLQVVAAAEIAAAAVGYSSASAIVTGAGAVVASTSGEGRASSQVIAVGAVVASARGESTATAVVTGAGAVVAAAIGDSRASVISAVVVASARGDSRAEAIISAIVPVVAAARGDSRATYATALPNVVARARGESRATAKLVAITSVRASTSGHSRASVIVSAFLPQVRSICVDLTFVPEGLPTTPGLLVEACPSAYPRTADDVADDPDLEIEGCCNPPIPIPLPPPPPPPVVEVCAGPWFYHNDVNGDNVEETVATPNILGAGTYHFYQGNPQPTYLEQFMQFEGGIGNANAYVAAHREFTAPAGMVITVEVDVERRLLFPHGGGNPIARFRAVTQDHDGGFQGGNFLDPTYLILDATELPPLGSQVEYNFGTLGLQTLSLTFPVPASGKFYLSFICVNSQYGDDAYSIKYGPDVRWNLPIKAFGFSTCTPTQPNPIPPPPPPNPVPPPSPAMAVVASSVGHSRASLTGIGARFAAAAVGSSRASVIVDVLGSIRATAIGQSRATAPRQALVDLSAAAVGHSRASVAEIVPQGHLKAAAVGRSYAAAIVSAVSGLSASSVSHSRATKWVASAPYAVITSKDWSTFATKAALAGLFTVEGGLGNCTAPRSGGGTMCDTHITAEDCYDLVADPIFGKAVKYIGSPSLNTISPLMPGRIATHKVSLGASRFNLWVRQFARFDPSWVSQGQNGQGQQDYEMMFLRYLGVTGSHKVKVGAGTRSIDHSSNEAGGIFVREGFLPLTNVQSINEICGITNFPCPDVFPIIKVTSTPCGALPIGDGDGQWYEYILRHRTVGTHGEFTLYWRRYTLNGVLSPGPWKIHSKFKDISATWLAVEKYEMGIHRNRQWDAPMNIYWGPYEVVDGSIYFNPFGVPL